jgi:hypothetical protein
MIIAFGHKVNITCILWYDIAEISLKLALNTNESISQSINRNSKRNIRREDQRPLLYLLTLSF